MTTYKVYAENMDERRRYLDTVVSDDLGNGIFNLYADEIDDDEQVVIEAV